VEVVFPYPPNILHQVREPLRRIFYDPVEQLMALVTQYDQIEGTLVTVVFITVVVYIQANVALSASLAAVHGPRQRSSPSYLPLGLHLVLREGHLPQLRTPRLPGKPSQSLLLAMEFKAEVGAGVAQQGNVPWVSGPGAREGTRRTSQAHEVSPVADVQ
jgi:hypothetical protein